MAPRRRLGSFHRLRGGYVTEVRVTQHPELRRAVRLVALLNLGYFVFEFAVARAIGSVSLFADSIDFLEDASVNGLILVASGWSAHRRSFVGMILAAILLAPALATVWTAWQKFSVPLAPAAVPQALTGLGALAIDLFCALLSPDIERIAGA